MQERKEREPAARERLVAATARELAEQQGRDEVSTPGLFTELFWAAVHGLAKLTRAGRLPPAEAGRRVELLVDRVAMV
ncbi:WHG domain-containing protein [Streptomyces sp. NPDC090108]|uniref:WHG domain-containing protein n=1 Tax=Streptomyces sp. NPDC090108 TaxID=3365947 RepID=UPI0037F468D5